MTWSTRRERFRAILGGNECQQPASVFDPVSTRIAEDIGYESAIVAGSMISLAVLGAPDKIVLTLSELAEQIRRMSRASELPLMIDADHGYGNALNVMRTVQELEMAGAAGLSIEDTLLPVAFGSGGKAQLISEAEAVGKMRAAVEARSDECMVIAGRTNLKATRDTADAVSRVRAYEAAGVDMIFLVGVDTHEQLDALSDAVALPFTVAASGSNVQDLDYLAARRVRVSVQGHFAHGASIGAMHEALYAARAGVASNVVPCQPPKEVVQKYLRTERYDHWQAEYL